MPNKLSVRDGTTANPCTMIAAIADTLQMEPVSQPMMHVYDDAERRRIEADFNLRLLSMANDGDPLVNGCPFDARGCPDCKPGNRPWLRHGSSVRFITAYCFLYFPRHRTPVLLLTI